MYKPRFIVEVPSSLVHFLHGKIEEAVDYTSYTRRQ